MCVCVCVSACLWVAALSVHVMQIVAFHFPMLNRTKTSSPYFLHPNNNNNSSSNNHNHNKKSHSIHALYKFSAQLWFWSVWLWIFMEISHRKYVCFNWTMEEFQTFFFLDWHLQHCEQNFPNAFSMFLCEKANKRKRKYQNLTLQFECCCSSSIGSTGIGIIFPCSISRWQWQIVWLMFDTNAWFTKIKIDCETFAWIWLHTIVVCVWLGLGKPLTADGGRKPN